MVDFFKWFIYLGKIVKLLNFNFTVINDIASCQKSKGNFSLGKVDIDWLIFNFDNLVYNYKLNQKGIFDIQTEDYTHLRACLKDYLAEIESIHFVVLNNVKFHIKFKFGGDLKFLLNIYGINAANSNYSCLWCKCHKDDFYKVR